MERARLADALDRSIKSHAFPRCLRPPGDSVLTSGRRLRRQEQQGRKHSRDPLRHRRRGLSSSRRWPVGKLIAAKKLSFDTRLKDCLTLDLPAIPRHHHPASAQRTRRASGLLRRGEVQRTLTILR